jgi:hypothetical protein
MEKKAIIIFDTNKLLQNPDEKRYYSEVDFGGDYNKVITEILPSYFLSESVDIAIPKMCIEEIKQRKIEDFISKFQSIETRYNKIKEDSDIIFNLVVQDFKDFTKKEDYENILLNQLDTFVNSQNIKIIEFPDDTHFKPIIQRAIKRKTPFICTPKDGSDKGFKDVVIWHSIMQHGELLEYDYLILFTQDNGFDLNCLDEFEEKHHKKIIRVEDVQSLKTQLLQLYPEEMRSKVEIKSKVSGEYFIEQLESSIKTILEEYKIVKDFEIVEPYVDSEIADEGYELKTKIKITFDREEIEPKEVVVSVLLNDIFEIQYVNEDFTEIFDEDTLGDKNE